VLARDAKPVSPGAAGKTVHQNWPDLAAGGRPAYTGVAIGDSKRKSRVNGFYADRPEDHLPILARRLTELDRLEVRHSVEAQFSYCRMVADYLAFYREILDWRGEVQAT
jgi:hypothetical protein